MMNTLNKICIALTIIFGVSLAVLLAEIFYVLLQGRRFRNRSGDEESLYTKSSKELFCFLCWKNQTTRIEPDAETIEIPVESAAPPSTTPVSELDEIMKRHALYGPSRVLFTIREEERDEIEMDSSPAEREEKEERSRCVSFEEIAVSITPVVIEIDDSTPPFSTPCGSPAFYTPSHSPPRDGAITVSLEVDAS